MTTILLAAGDLSGERHAADWVRAMRERHPDVRFVGMGGQAMAKAGVELAVDQRELAVGGLVEIAGSLRRILRVWRRMLELVDSARPDLVVLVDSGGFNLPFARRIKARFGTPILYYVAPQVWAWRQGRIRKLAKRVDRIAVILPFEAEVYARHGVDVDFVGHPLADRLHWTTPAERAEARRELRLPEQGPVVALFPGSRRNELAHQLGVQLEAARILAERVPGARFVLGLAESLEPGGSGLLGAGRRDGGLPGLQVVAGRTESLLRAADVALVKPGTITVEAMLLGCPMVCMGRANALTAVIVRRALRVPWLAMPNLIAGREIVPELLQAEARPEAIAAALEARIEGPERDAQRAALAEAAERLGGGGAAERACRIAEELLGTDRPT